MEQNKSTLVEGIRIFDRNANTPDFVIANMVITLQEFREFVNNNQEHLTKYDGKDQLRIQLLRSKAGKLYCSVDTYKKDQPATQSVQKPEPKPVDVADDLPF